MVLAKRGSCARVLHYGDTDYQHNYSLEAQANYCSRSAGITNQSGELTKDNPLYSNYWSRTDLWSCSSISGRKRPPVYVRDVRPYNAITIPPFGIFVSPDHIGNEKLLQHEFIHWDQYERMGLLMYYLNYIDQYIRYGYDKMPMEVEARLIEDDYCRLNYTECVRNGRAKTVASESFRLRGPETW